MGGGRRGWRRMRRRCRGSGGMGRRRGGCGGVGAGRRGGRGGGAGWGGGGGVLGGGAGGGVGYGVLRYLRGVAALQAQRAARVRFNYLGQVDQVVGAGQAWAAAPEP